MTVTRWVSSVGMDGRATAPHSYPTGTVRPQLENPVWEHLSGKPSEPQTPLVAGQSKRRGPPSGSMPLETKPAPL